MRSMPRNENKPTRNVNSPAMPESSDFNAFVGAETGILKALSVNPKANLTKNFHVRGVKPGEKLSKEDEITCLEWGGGDAEVLIASRSRCVRAFDVDEKAFVECVDLTKQEGCPEGAIRGLARYDECLLTASESGVVRLWRYNESTPSTEFNTIDAELQSSGKLKRNSFDSEEERSAHLAKLRAEGGRKLCRMRQAPSDRAIIATGGKENDLQIWDLRRPDAPKFRARNVRPDFLELRVPVWISDLCFPDALSPEVVAVASRHGHVRLYDARVQDRRRPVGELEFPEEALTAMAPTSNTNQVLVGSAQGRLALFDFRKESKGSKGLFRKYKGFVGSVRSIDSRRDGPYFAAAGLDRFVRVYDINGKTPLQKMYLKSRLNCVLLSRGFDPTKEEGERREKSPDLEVVEEFGQDGDDDRDSAAEDDDDDELWDNMDAVEEKSRPEKKRRKKT